MASSGGSGSSIAPRQDLSFKTILISCQCPLMQSEGLSISRMSLSCLLKGPEPSFPFRTKRQSGPVGSDNKPVYELEKEGIYLLVVHVAAISNTQPVEASVHVEMRAPTGGFLSVTDWPLLPFYGVSPLSHSNILYATSVSLLTLPCRPCVGCMLCWDSPG